MKIYLLDENNCFKGIEDINPLLPLPRCVTTPPPETDGEEVACFIGNKWVVLDNYPIVEPPIQIPQTLTPRQARLILLKYELLDDIELLIQSHKEIQIWWEYSLEIERSNPQLLEFAKIAKIPEEQLDTMFIEGNAL